MSISARLWVVGLLGVAGASGASAHVHQQDPATPSPEDVSRFIQSGLDDLDIPGVAAAVIEDGRITLARGFGRRDGAGNPVTAQTPFQIASVSKSFTALVILQLADEGRLAIDDPVINHVPYFRMADSAHTRAVTLRHLMNHEPHQRILDH